MKNETYMKKEARDRRILELKAQGYKVRKTSIRNQLLHPMYINDYPHKLSDEDRGFGNTLYKTFFSVLYSYEIIEDLRW